MPDPKYQGSDISFARRIGKKHGPDVERRRMRADQFYSKIQSAARRRARKRSRAEMEMARLQQFVTSSFDEQLRREGKVLSDWARRQLDRMRDRLVSSVLPEDAASIDRARRKYENFADLITSLEE